MMVHRRLAGAAPALFLVALLLLASLGMAGCVLSAEDPGEDPADAKIEDAKSGGDGEAAEGEPAEVPGESAEDSAEEGPTLEEFVEADTKTADFTLKTFSSSGELLYDQEGEFWLTPDRFRYDLYEDGELIRSILTPDGVHAYFVQHGERICEPAVATVENYMAKFSPPPVEAVEDGIDEETDAIRMRYPVEETYSVPGASNGWYQEDIVFLVRKGAVVGIVTRGYPVTEEDPVGDMHTMRRLLTDTRVGEEIPGDTFDLPYPIQGQE
jgi:hypothetical protein